MLSRTSTEVTNSASGDTEQPGGDWRPTQNGESLPASVPCHSKPHRTPEPSPTLLHTLLGNAQCPTATGWGGQGHLTVQPVQRGLLRLQRPLVQVPPNVREAPKLVACCCVQTSICAGQVPISVALQPGDSHAGHQHPHAPRRRVRGGPSADLLRLCTWSPPGWHPLEGCWGWGHGQWIPHIPTSPGKVLLTHDEAGVATGRVIRALLLAFLKVGRQHEPVGILEGDRESG